MSDTIEITRYPNRRLYDRSQKKYVTVRDIEAMVMDGKNIRIVDNKSGDDITRVILIQIILERHPERVKMFPVPFLHEILRADQFALDWFTVYFGQAKQLLEGVAQPSARPLVPGLDWWRTFMPGGASQSEPAQDEATSADTQAERLPKSQGSQKQRELASRLIELERRLKQLEQGNESGND